MFNELGRCWGFLVGAHNDIPNKIISDLTLSSSIVSIAPTKDLRKKRTKKEKKKESKKRKKDRKSKKSESRPSAESLEIPDSPPS